MKLYHVEHFRLLQLDVVDTEPYVFESYEDTTSDSEYTFTDMNIPPVGEAYITASRDVSLDNNTSFWRLHSLFPALIKWQKLILMLPVQV
mgnify:CR=1 FL=1